MMHDRIRPARLHGAAARREAIGSFLVAVGILATGYVLLWVLP